MHRWIGSPEVMQHLSFGTSSLAESRAHLELVLTEQRRPDRERYWLAVELCQASRAIGDVGLTIEVSQGMGRIGNLGWFLEKAYWGQGLATEAARLIVDFGFEELELDGVRASCDALNVASERIMRRCGLRFVREVPRQSRPGRRRHYELVRADRRDLDRRLIAE